MSTSPRKKASSTHAIELLTADHKEAKTLFKAYEQLVKAEGEDDEREQLAQEICIKLAVHATVEEELFYPAARALLIEDEDLVDEADVEHACAREMMAEIMRSAPSDPLYDAKVKVLGEYIEHHVREEEDEMFPRLRKAGLDADSLGDAMALRKDQLLTEMADAA